MFGSVIFNIIIEIILFDSFLPYYRCFYMVSNYINSFNQILPSNYAFLYYLLFNRLHIDIYLNHFNYSV